MFNKALFIIRNIRLKLIFDGNHNDPAHNGVYVNHDELLRVGDLLFGSENSKEILDLYELPCQEKFYSRAKYSFLRYSRTPGNLKKTIPQVTNLNVNV